ncbi:hypothetical protein Tco_0994735 [Tanacetum coccineum]
MWQCLVLNSVAHDTKVSSKSFPKHETRHVAEHKNVARCARLFASEDTSIIRFEDFEPSKDKDQAGSSKKGKAPSQPSKTDKTANAEETIHKAAMEIKELVEGDVVNAEGQPQDVVFAKNHLKKDKITKADLEGPALKLLKASCRNYIELEYNMEHCYLALTDQLDWMNPQGDRVPYNLSKLLSLQGPPGHTTIPVDLFFNKDLEYLKNGNTKKRYASSLTKPKAARSKRQQFYITRHAVTSLHTVYSRMKILSITKLSIDKKFGYGHLKKVVGEELSNKLNVTRPQVRCDGLDVKEPYTIMYEPRGVVYLNNNKGKLRCEHAKESWDGKGSEEEVHSKQDRRDIADQKDHEKLRVFCGWKKYRDGL